MYKLLINGKEYTAEQDKKLLPFLPRRSAFDRSPKMAAARELAVLAPCW